MQAIIKTPVKMDAKNVKSRAYHAAFRNAQKVGWMPHDIANDIWYSKSDDDDDYHDGDDDKCVNGHGAGDTVFDDGGDGDDAKAGKDKEDAGEIARVASHLAGGGVLDIY